MKTKYLFSTVVFFTLLSPIFSQQYRPFLNHSSWIVNDWVSCCRPPIIHAIAEGHDVVVGNFTYKRFNDPFPRQNLETYQYLDSIDVREDVAARKVYKLVDGLDTLLYDFSLEPGATFSQYGYTWSVEVDEIAVNGGTRKRITLHSIELYAFQSLTQVWIEGVGSNAHPFYPSCNMYTVSASGGGLRYLTKCSFQEGVYIYGNSAYCSTTDLLGMPQKLFASQEITFSPNPFASALNINASIPLLNATFKLYNLQGQIVREIKQGNGKILVLDRDNLNSGLYFGQLFENGNLIKSGKILVD